MVHLTSTEGVVGKMVKTPQQTKGAFHLSELTGQAVPVAMIILL